MHKSQSPTDGNAPCRPPGPYAARLAAIRAEINSVRAANYSYGCNGPHRRQRDEEVLLAIAADLRAKMLEARAA